MIEEQKQGCLFAACGFVVFMIILYVLGSLGLSTQEVRDEAARRNWEMEKRRMEEREKAFIRDLNERDRGWEKRAAEKLDLQ
jgi:hypothetical protein